MFRLTVRKDLLVVHIALAIDLGFHFIRRECEFINTEMAKSQKHFFRCWNRTRYKVLDGEAKCMEV